MSGVIAVWKLDRGIPLRDLGPVNTGDLEKSIFARCYTPGGTIIRVMAEVV